MKVLVCDSISEQGLNIFKQEEGVEVDVQLKKTEDELCELAKEAQAIVVRSGVKITKKIIENADKLKVIGRAGVGVDNIDVEAATKKGIVVVNTPDGNTTSAAEHTMGMMLALARHIPQAYQSLCKGKWDRSKYMGIELRNKNMGIIGFGKIGSEVGKRCKAFGMNVIIYDPYVTEEAAQRAGVRRAALDELLAESDFITVHMPLTDETRNMIGKKQFAKMKDGVRILNVARGGLINEEALYEAILNKKVAGAALDVYEKEPQTESPLFKLPEVVATPHLGASTQEAQVNVALDVASEIIRVLRGEPVQNAVNIPFVKPEQMEVVRPYIELTEKLGKLAASLAEGPIDKIELKYVGEITKIETNSLTNSFLKALLRPSLHDAVNYVNAPLVAKQRGIIVNETKSMQKEDYTNKISVTIKGNGKWSRYCAGSVFKNGQVRILSIDEFSLDIQPEGNLILILHKDRPKFVGQIGMILGEKDVNIAGMQLARKKPGGKALMILTVDHPVEEEVMSKINEIQDVENATHMAF